MEDSQEKGRLILPEKEGRKFYIFWMTFVATIGGFLFGYDTGIVSGSMLLIRDVFSLSTLWQQLIVSGTVATAAIFSLVAGVTADKYGRKVTILMSTVVFTLGAVVMGVAPDKEILLVGRLVVGVGIGEFL